MDESVTQADHWHRSQLNRQLQRLVRAVAVLGYCRRSDAIDTVAESITEVEQTLTVLNASPTSVTDYLQQIESSSQSESQRLLIEAHTLLSQARSLINMRTQTRFDDLNVVEMRGNHADLADAAFERMLAASDTASIYSSTVATEHLCFAPDQANDTPDNSLEKPSTNSKNKRITTKLKLVVNNSDSSDSQRG